MDLQQNSKKTRVESQKWKWPSSGKENMNPSTKLKSAFSTNQAEQVMKEVRANATKTFNNVKTTFDNISQRLKSSRKRINSMSSYAEFENRVTPVKLYSPFGIETPSPCKNVETIQERRRLTPRKFNFVSPTGKLRRDVDDLSRGVRELHTVAKSLKGKSRP